MRAFQDQGLEPTLSGTLSARSYLELAPEAPSPDDISPPNTLTSPLEEQTKEGKSTPRLRPRNERLMLPDSEKPETALKARGQPSPDRPARKRGRPRLETVKDAAAIEERRLQIRRAQRTYRQKKETTITTLKTRVDALEQTLQGVSDLLGPVGHHSVDIDIDRARRLVMAEIDRSRPYSQIDQYEDHTTEFFRGTFGYHVSRAVAEGSDLYKRPQKQNMLPNRPQPRSPSPLLNRLFPSTTIYTYSYQESELSRRLQRFCLEHTYRWLSDPHSEPSVMIRVFGLVPCIHDMPGVRRAFRRVLQSEIGSPLEGNKLPFYTLGGAGKHFPRTNTEGQVVYPENTRRPGKILRRLARIFRRGGIQDWDEDWSGDAEPRVGDWQDEKIRSMGDEDRLRALDLDGEWFDCHDVQGYLEQRGVGLDGSSLWLEVPAAVVGDLHGVLPDLSASQFYVSSELSPSETSSQNSGQSNYVLDVENFFELLLANLRILGRAPGFRVCDVDAALRSAIHRRPSS